MKLYNLFQEVILENIENEHLLTEGVADNDIIKAIQDSKGVNILYRDSPKLPPSKRYILPMVYGELHNGNYAIRAHQIQGGSKRGNKNAATKIFRVDRIDGWYPTNMKIRVPVDNYNPDGDKKFDLGSRTVQDTFKRIIAQAEPIVNKGNVNQNNPQMGEPNVNQDNPETGELNNDLK